MTMTHDVCLRHRMLPRETTMCKQSMQSVICTWLSLQTDYAIRPSWIPFCRGVNNCRNSPAKSGWLIGCAPGHQVTPRLNALFHTGASGDSSTFARFSAHGRQVTPHLRAQGHQRPLAFMHFSVQGDEVTPCTTRVPYRLEWVSERSPLQGILYTRQPLTWGWYHLNEGVSSTHGRHFVGMSLITWVLKVHHWSRADGLIFKKMSQ